MQINLQTKESTKHRSKRESSNLVDGNTKDNAKKDKCSEKTIPTDDKQLWAKREQEE